MSESYDPRTWRRGDHDEGAPVSAPHQRSAWLALVVSAAILIAGAAMAYTARPAASETVQLS